MGTHCCSLDYEERLHINLLIPVFRSGGTLHDCDLPREVLDIYSREIYQYF